MNHKKLIVKAYKNIVAILPELGIETKPDDQLDVDDFLELLDLVYKKRKDFLANPDKTSISKTKIKQIGREIENILTNIANEEIKYFNQKKLVEKIISAEKDLEKYQQEKQELLDKFRLDKDIIELTQETGIDIESLLKISIILDYGLQIENKSYKLSMSRNEYESIIDTLEKHLANNAAENKLENIEDDEGSLSLAARVKILKLFASKRNYEDILEAVSSQLINLQDNISDEEFYFLGTKLASVIEKKILPLKEKILLSENTRASTYKENQFLQEQLELIEKKNLLLLEQESSYHDESKAILLLVDKELSLQEKKLKGDISTIEKSLSLEERVLLGEEKLLSFKETLRSQALLKKEMLLLKEGALSSDDEIRRIAGLVRKQLLLFEESQSLQDNFLRDLLPIISPENPSFKTALSSYAKILKKEIAAKEVVMESILKINSNEESGSKALQLLKNEGLRKRIEGKRSNSEESITTPKIGSHNSAISSAYSNWWANQKLTITEQLDAGVEVLELDISSAENGDEIIITHDGYRTNWPYKTLYKDIIEEIGDWLKKNPKTIIIQLDNGKLNGGKTSIEDILQSGIVEKLIQPIKEYIGEENIYKHEADKVNKKPDEADNKLLNSSLEELIDALTKKNTKVILLSQIDLPEQDLFKTAPWGQYLKNSLETSEAKKFIESGGSNKTFAEVGEGGGRSSISPRKIYELVASGVKIISLDFIEKNDRRISAFHKAIEDQNSQHSKLCPAITSDGKLTLFGCHLKLPVVVKLSNGRFAGDSSSLCMTWEEAQTSEIFIPSNENEDIFNILPSWTKQENLNYKGNGLEYAIESPGQIPETEEINNNYYTSYAGIAILSLIGAALIYNLYNSRGRFKEKEAALPTTNPEHAKLNQTKSKSL